MFIELAFQYSLIILPIKAEKEKLKETADGRPISGFVRSKLKEWGII